MAFTTLSELSTLSRSLNEAEYEDMGMGPKSHPVLSRAEMVRLYDKIERAQAKTDELHAIFKPVEGAVGPAHKLHHLGTKGGFDMSHVQTVQGLLDSLSDALDQLHQDWGINMQQDTGAYEEEPQPEEAPADDARE